ncbi:Phage tail fiber protein [Mariniradius saccharolyticus AK6]|uniref:Phage tail fiber protein n=2 Tax=Mariniradius TaxID=1245590 RepID=M7Y146_9BACT|nr:Phage tail fiber protein [Mariniradius saccharolyticus AK6]
MRYLNIPKTTLKIFLGGLAIISLSIACEGPEGPAGAIGPAGPQGVAGAQGPAGTKGPNGIQGETGTENVFFSNWITNTWTRMPDNYVWDTIPAPQITEEILNRGVVVAYYRDNSTIPWAKIYPVQIYQNGNWIFTLESKSIKENLILFHGPSRNGGIVDAITTIPFSQVRYMVIPGVNPAGRMNFPDLNDYKAVCSYFGINP